MTPIFRTVYFRPQLALDWRMPVAALVSKKGRSRPVTAEVLPDPNCLGSLGASELLRFGIAEIMQLRDGSLPPSLGPHFELGPTQPVPPGLEDAEKWIRKTVLPRRLSHSSESEKLNVQRIPTLAWNHLSNWGVANYVKKRLNPKKLPELSRLPPKVGTVTHYVVGERKILLLEPLSLSSSAVDAMIASIFSKYSAYSAAWDGRDGRQHERVAYLLPGPTDQLSVSEAKAQLKAVARVFDTGKTGSLGKFKGLIKKIGDTGPRAELV